MSEAPTDGEHISSAVKAAWVMSPAMLLSSSPNEWTSRSILLSCAGNALSDAESALACARVMYRGRFSKLIFSAADLHRSLAANSTSLASASSPVVNFN